MMKNYSKGKIFALVFVVFAIGVFVCLEGRIVQAEAEKEVTHWNSASLSFFYNEQSEAALTEFLSEWEIQPMLWPTKKEIESCLGVATEDQKKDFMKWIRRLLKDEWVPDEITDYLLPLRKWAKESKTWKEDGKNDAFLCRYAIDNYLIHIVQSAWYLTITVREMNDTPPVEKVDHIDFARQTFLRFWQGNVSQLDLAQQQSQNITKGSMLFGKEGVLFMTDGKVVKFRLTKFLSGKALFAPPYRFPE